MIRIAKSPAIMKQSLNNVITKIVMPPLINGRITLTQKSAFYINSVTLAVQCIMY